MIGAEPIKLGVLVDAIPSQRHAREIRDDYLQVLELVFEEGLNSGLLDRPVEVVYRETPGLPRGTVKAVIDAFDGLVDEGCLAVFGPNITENAVPVREEIERRFRVPALSLCGSEDWLGEWTFALPNGSMTDEPILWADLVSRAGLPSVGVLVEQSLIGRSYLENLRQACRDAGIQIAAEVAIAQVEADVSAAVLELRDAGAAAIVHCGFGYGVALVNAALDAAAWDPPRYTGTAFELAYWNPDSWDAYLGWVGLEQYDEANVVGQAFLDRFAARYARRPEHYGIVVKRDVAATFLGAFAGAKPLSPRGVRDAIEQIKMLPAASGSPGTRISFGNWMHRGWMGAGYLVARQLDPRGKSEGSLWKTTLVGRYGEPPVKDA